MVDELFDTAGYWPGTLSSLNFAKDAYSGQQAEIGIVETMHGEKP